MLKMDGALHQDVFFVALCQPGDAHLPFYGDAGLGIAYDREVLTEIARRLQLSYLPEEIVNTETCFVHSPELRSEFKSAFNLRDFTDFLNAALQDQAHRLGPSELQAGKLRIPYPENPDVFWRLVAAGQVNR